MNRSLPLYALLIAVALLAAGSPALASATPKECSDRFQETTWEVVSMGSVSIATTGFTPELTERFREEIELVDGWISEEIGEYTTTVCLVSEESSFDSTRYETGSNLFHAHSDLPERLLVLNVERSGLIAPAAAYGLSQHALWQLNGDEAFPVPIAKVIGQWYRARVLERLDQYHRDVMFTNFFDTDAIVDWTSSTQKPVQNWDPEKNFAAIGDFMDFAVKLYGTDILLEKSSDRWSEIEGEWRVALRNDLRGRDTDTTGWIGGVVITVTSILVAVIAVILGLWAKYRRRERSETLPPIPGYFTEK